MAEIRDDHVEWAVVNRLAEMLRNPPRTEFRVSHAFAVFSAIVLWSKNRIWVGGNRQGPERGWQPADHRAFAMRQGLAERVVDNSEWLPRALFASTGSGERHSHPAFEPGQMNVPMFLKWLRDSLAHGDGRNLRPLHRAGRQGGNVLDGMAVTGESSRGSGQYFTAEFTKADMVRIGCLLADQFCAALSGDDAYFERDAATARITEVA